MVPMPDSLLLITPTASRQCPRCWSPRGLATSDCRMKNARLEQGVWRVQHSQHVPAVGCDGTRDGKVVEDVLLGLQVGVNQHA